MKKLSVISNQIKSNTFSYTGKGAFEAIVNKHIEKVKEWLENLTPLQEQINRLDELENVEFQKRNYTRILTKLLPNEYKEFVSLNILVRDSKTIAEYYQEDYNLTAIYNKLISNKLLKYPGKYDKYVEFEVFQRFVMTYREDLIISLDNTDNTATYIEPEEIYEPIEETIEIESNIEQKDEIVEESIQEQTKEEEIKEEEKPLKKKETNWTNLLLGKLK